MPSEPDGIPRLFAVGMAAILLVPLFLALSAAWYHSQQTPGRPKVSDGNDDSEEDALQTSRRDSWDHTPSRGAGTLARVYFRQAGECCSCMNKPLVVKVALDPELSLGELHATLHRAYEQVCVEHSSSGRAHSVPALVVEYRNVHATLVRVTKQTGLRDLADNVKALYVSIRPPPLCNSSGSTCGLDSVGCLYDTDGLDGGTDDDDKSSLVSDTASSVLVDMSLAGCCGVQSTCGGLVITASFHPKGAPSAPDRSKTRSKSLSKARLPPVPAPAGASQV